MKPKKIAITILHIFIIHAIFRTFDILSCSKITAYLFSWASENHYLYLWLFADLLVIFHRPLISYSITIGNILGVAAGQFLGDYIVEINSAKLTVNSTAEECYKATYHYGAFIYFFIVIMSFFVGLLLHKKVHKKAS